MADWQTRISLDILPATLMILLSCLCVFTAVGCPDVMTSQHMWTTRRADQLIAGCVTSQVTWTLTCVGNWWQGVSSNCSVGR